MGLFRKVECDHVPEAIADPSGDTCVECGSTFNLRFCADCGKVSCCESQLAHNRQHAYESGHPVIIAYPPRETSFTWCYECRAYV